VSGCDEPGCPLDERRLYVVVDGRGYCSTHWKAAGRPWPRAVASMERVHEAELQTRARMTARGGTDRHMVRNGRT
jgi:hypothetical protein